MAPIAIGAIPLWQPASAKASLRICAGFLTMIGNEASWKNRQGSNRVSRDLILFSFWTPFFDYRDSKAVTTPGMARLSQPEQFTRSYERFHGSVRIKALRYFPLKIRGNPCNPRSPTAFFRLRQPKAMKIRIV